MQKRIKTLLKDNIIVMALAITITIIFLSLYKLPSANIGVKNADKIYHAIAYFTLAFAWLLTFYKKAVKKYIVVLSCIIFGIVIEVIQATLTNYRTGDYIDVFANSLGVCLALVVFNLFFKKK